MVKKAQVRVKGQTVSVEIMQEMVVTILPNTQTGDAEKMFCIWPDHQENLGAKGRWEVRVAVLAITVGSSRTKKREKIQPEVVPKRAEREEAVLKDSLLSNDLPRLLPLPVLEARRSDNTS